MKPLLLLLGAFAVVGLLMLGGWALTSGTPDVPARPSPATGGGATTGTSSTGGPSGAAKAAPPAAERETEDAPRSAAARDLETQRARQGTPQPRAAGPAGVGRSSSSRLAQPLRRAPDDEAAARARADAERLAARRRAEQLRRAEIARQEEAAQHGDEAERSAQRAGDEDEAGEE